MTASPFRKVLLPIRADVFCGAVFLKPLRIFLCSEETLLAKFFTFASSSGGNAYYLGSCGCGILIDAGISCRAIVSGLKSRDIQPESLSGILLTHEHIDHVKGLSVFLSHYPIPVYASAAVLKFLVANNLVPFNALLHELDEHGELIGSMMVVPFSTSHDSVGSFGYRIITSDEHKFSICTDTGYLTDEAKNGLIGSDVVLIESNYDKNMLATGPYPYSLKRRIAGEKGHLSNTDCAVFLPELVRSGTTYFILAHLSKENNIPALAVETSVSELSMAGIRRDSDYRLFAAPRNELSETIVL